jgi:hypothetical protein
MFERFGWRILAGLVIIVLVLGVVGLVGWTAYNTGLVQGAAQSGANPAPGTGALIQGPPYLAPYPFAPFGYGFGLTGCLVPLLLVFLVFALFRLLFWRGMWGRSHWGWRGPGLNGPGGNRMFVPDEVKDAWREKAEAWHRQMHEQAVSEASQEKKS